MADSFTPDDNIRKIAEAYSLDCVDFGNQHFKLKLDWSDGSVREIENDARALSCRVLFRQTDLRSRYLSSLRCSAVNVGEVFRRNHGAQWGMVALGGDTFPGLKGRQRWHDFLAVGARTEPLVKRSGGQYVHYYQVLVSEHGNPAPTTGPAPNDPPPKKSFWQRMRGA